MTQGTMSVLFGCHSPVHSLIVVAAWRRLYGEFPKPWQFVCILLHDVGHWGTQYLDNYAAKRSHWRAGARAARCLFGLKGYDLIRGHCSYDGQDRSRLYAPDKYSWIMAPAWWMWTNTIFEPKLIRPNRTRMQSVKDFKTAMLKNWNGGLAEQGHDIYLRQWKGERQ